MKAYIIATIITISAAASVSNATCMKKFLSSEGLHPNSNTNFHAQVTKNSSGASRTGTASHAVQRAK